MLFWQRRSLRSPEAAVRAEAVHNLESHARCAEVIDLLRTAQRDEDQSVQSAATRAMGLVHGKLPDLVHT